MSSLQISDIKDKMHVINAQLCFLSSALTSWDTKALPIEKIDKAGFAYTIENIADQIQSIDRDLII